MENNREILEIRESFGSLSRSVSSSRLRAERPACESLGWREAAAQEEASKNYAQARTKVSGADRLKAGLQIRWCLRRARLWGRLRASASLSGSDNRQGRTL